MFTKTETFIATATTLLLGLSMPGIAQAQTAGFSAQAIACLQLAVEEEEEQEEPVPVYDCRATGVLDGQTVAYAEVGNEDQLVYASVNRYSTNNLLDCAVTTKGFSVCRFTDTLEVSSDTLPVGTPVALTFSNWISPLSVELGTVESILHIGSAISVTSSKPATFEDVPMLTVYTEVGAFLHLTAELRVDSSGPEVQWIGRYHLYDNQPAEAGFYSAGSIIYNPNI